MRAAKPAEFLDAEHSAETVDPILIEDQVNLGIAPDLAGALAQLSDRDREVIALRFGGGMNGPEIATALGLTLANVQQILSRSLRRMRDALEDAC